MKTIYFISDDLDEIELVEKELKESGLHTWQLQTLSKDDMGVANHHLHTVPSFMRNDTLHYMQGGAIIGVIAAMVVLWTAKATGAAESLGWGIFFIFSVIAFGFCTWEGGLLGQSKRNHKFSKFEKELKEGKHLFMVETDDEHMEMVKQKVLSHDHFQPA